MAENVGKLHVEDGRPIWQGIGRSRRILSMLSTNHVVDVDLRPGEQSTTEIISDSERP
jgi:hypothetical protein